MLLGTKTVLHVEVLVIFHVGRVVVVEEQQLRVDVMVEMFMEVMES